MITRVRVDDLRVSCLIGCLDLERVRPQEVRLDAEVELDASAAADGDDLRRTWDYAAFAGRMSFVLEEGGFHLLETAVRFLLRSLLLPPVEGSQRSPVLGARVRLTKFKALPGDATAQVELAGTVDSVTFRQEQKPWGTVDIVDECRRLGLYRLNVAPGAEIPNHLHRVMSESELVLHPGLSGWIDGSKPRTLEVGERFRWKHELPHGYRNVGERTASLLCIDSPPFDPADEVVVP